MIGVAIAPPLLAAADAVRLQRLTTYLVAHGGMVENVDGQPVTRATPIEVLDLILHLDVAWRHHPDYTPGTFPPPAMSVWAHAPYKGHAESYGVGGLTDITSPAHLKWGARTLGVFAGVRAVPPEIPVHPQRETFSSWSLKGSGLKFRARQELKRRLPKQYRGLVNKTRPIARETKAMAYKGLAGERPDRADPAYRQMTADEVRYQEFLRLYGDRMAGIERYIAPRDFWACAIGRVHPDEVAARFHQLELFAA